MRAWWSRLAGSPRALTAVGAGVVVATIVTFLVTTGDDTAPAAAGTPSSTSSTSSPRATAKPKESNDPQADLPPDKDAYCPAFRKIREGGLTTPGGEDEDGVDLAELSRTFDGLLSRYLTAQRVSPLSLRDDYAQAVGYLKQGKKATTSRDVDLLKALVVNLDNLNDSLDAIETRSAQFCG